MASENKRKTNKQSTITFTLPLSCQICLGKVKQPVLCPNHHVFCQLCMDIWLERNKQCPTCRVEINDNNPVKSIIGGQLEDEDANAKKQSSAELRRARFELLYKEYEDQFDQMRKESIILRTENNILLAQLQDAEDNNDAQNKTEKESKASSSGKNEPNLLMLTKNLQEAQTLYVGIKEEMTQLKRENSKMKDENVNLTRENENLRLEIAQRSPKKFGRYTVATLETKVAEYEKEIRQLKKALERSDEYVEDLEKQIQTMSESRDERHEQKSSKIKNNSNHSRVNGHIHTNGTEQSISDSEESGDRRVLEPVGSKTQDRESARRILFSLCAESEDKLVKNSGRGDSKTEDGNGEECDRVKYPESIMKHGGGGDDSHKQFNNGGLSDLHAKVSAKTKKVHFNVPKPTNTNTSASFELEMPSPYSSNSQFVQNQKDNSESKDRVIKEEENLNENGDEVDGHPSTSTSDFDTHIVSLLRKANVSAYNKSHNIPGIKVASSGDLISKHDPVRNPIPKKSSAANIHYEESNDSSRLSLPEFDSPRKLTLSDSDAALSDSPRKPGVSGRDVVLELDDSDHKSNDKLAGRSELDISMTPEMSDCLRLMNQAQRKLEMPSTNGYSDRGTNLTSSLKPNPASTHVASSHSANPRAPPVAYNSSMKPQSFSSTSESMKSWEQEFFRGLQANPFKPYKFNNNNNNNSHPSSSLASVSSSNKTLHDKLVQNGLPSSLHDDFPSLKKASSSISHSNGFANINTNTSALSSYPTNPKPFPSAPSSSRPYSPSTNIYGDGFGSSHSNPLTSHFDKLQSFTNSNPISLSSSDHPFAASGRQSPLVSVPAPPPPPQSSSSSSALGLSSFNHLSKNSSNYLSSSSKDFHNGLYSSGHSNKASASSSHVAFHNPLPPSLNNSSLEWPDSPVKSLSSLDHPSDIGSSKDFLPQPSSSLRDRNRFTSTAGTSSPRNLQDYNFPSANSSFSSDVNNSSFLPEPKKRLFTVLDDGLDLPTNKTAKK